MIPNEDICIGCGKCAEDCFPGAVRMKNGYSVYAVIVAGHPDVRYHRTVPRKPADIIWD